MKKNILLLAFAMAGLSACQSQDSRPSTSESAAATTPSKPHEDLNVAAFREKMKEPGIVLLDVRTPAETAAGKIEGAVELDFYDPDFAGKVAGLDKDKTYLVYCRSGNRSGKACRLMKQQGFGHLYNLEGGYLAWSAE
ncbi:MAG: hypothetical protein RLY31_1600 [Bacteroidota bacterium]|jgi:rhodanese-related sulfurtransferase